VSCFQTISILLTPGMIHIHVNFEENFSSNKVETSSWYGYSAESPPPEGQLLLCLDWTVYLGNLSGSSRSLLFVLVAIKPHWLSESTICHTLKSGLPGSPRMDSLLVPSGSGNLASTRHLRLLPVNWLWGSRWPTLHRVAFVNLEHSLPLIIDQHWPSQLACSFADNLP
jgi:hypothetical protein